MKSDALSLELPEITTGKVVGSGAFGEVRLVELHRPWGELEAGSLVVVKRLQPAAWGDKDAEARLLVEGRLGMTLTNPGFVRVLAAGFREREAAPEIVMEWIPGSTLEHLLEAGPCPEPLVRSLGNRIAGALGELHGAGYAHADVKPENIRLDAKGHGRLLDLGFATKIGPGSSGLKHDPGSPIWMAPERRRGGGPSTASDVYSLGLVLFLAATGKPPGAPIPKPSTLAPRLTPFIDELIGEMLSANPRSRPTAAEVQERLNLGEASPWWQTQVTTLGAAAPTRPRARGPLNLIIELGRAEQLQQLSCLAPSQVVLLRGEEGSGKWELVHEFAARARRSKTPPLFLSTRATPMVEARPYGSLLSLLRAWLGCPRDTQVLPTHVTRLQALVSPLSLDTLVAALTLSHEGPVEGSLQAAFAEWMLALPAQSQAIIFIDELQDAGEETRRTLLQVAAAKGPGSPTLVFGERDDLAAHPDPRFTAVADLLIELGALTSPAIAKIIAALFDRATPRLRLTKVLMDRSRGNPALLYEVIRSLKDSGATKRSKTGLRLLVAPEDLPIPASLQASIGERFQRLERADRSVLARMAILAGHLSPDLLRRAFGDERDEDLGAVITSLTRQRWLIPSGDHYRFARPALREAVLAALSPVSRKRLHREAAAGLAPRPGESASVGTAIRRAWHLRESGEMRALLGTVRTVVRSLVDRGQPQRVSALVDWGLEALDALEREPGAGLTIDEQHLRLSFLEHAAAAANRMGARERERVLLDKLADLGVDPASDPFRTARIYLMYGRHARDTGALGMARGLFRNAYEFAKEAKRPLLEARCLALLAKVLAEGGDLETAKQYADRAWDLANKHKGTAGSAPILAGTALTRAHVAVLRGRPDRALLFVDRALAILRMHRDTIEPGLRARAHLLRARIWRDLGRPARARGSANKARELAQLAHERALEAEAAARLGGLFVDAGQLEEAEAHLRDALLIAREIEDKRGICLAQLWLGTLLAEADDPEAASALASAAALAKEVGLHRPEAMAYALAARVKLIDGDLTGAMELADRAKKMLDQQGAELRDRIVITGTWAMVLHHNGRGDEAVKVAKELRRKMRSASDRIGDSSLRQLHRKQTTKLLESVLSVEGPVYPRAEE
ncbi:MAG: serine/threonine protein kinase/tetratricopeptide (TPR) repeat protein [Planctomycetota bacterium]